MNSNDSYTTYLDALTVLIMTGRTMSGVKRIHVTKGTRTSMISSIHYVAVTVRHGGTVIGMNASATHFRFYVLQTDRIVRLHIHASQYQKREADQIIRPSTYRETQHDNMRF